MALSRPGARKAMMGAMSAAQAGPDDSTDDGPTAAHAGWSAQMNALGEFIRAQRQLAKLSLREMASMTSVSNAYLSQVERGLHQPSLKVLHSIADALQLSTEQLLSPGRLGHRHGDRAGGRPSRVAPRRRSARTRDSPRSSAPRCWASTAASSTAPRVERAGSHPLLDILIAGAQSR